MKDLREVNKAGKRDRRHILCRRLRTLWLSGLKKRRPRSDLMALSNSLRRGRAEGGVGLCSLGTHGRTCQNGTKLCPRRFQLDIRENVISVRIVNHWNRLPGEVVDAPCLLVFIGITLLTHYFPLIICFNF